MLSWTMEVIRLGLNPSRLTSEIEKSGATFWPELVHPIQDRNNSIDRDLHRVWEIKILEFIPVYGFAKYQEAC